MLPRFFPRPLRCSLVTVESGTPDLQQRSIQPTLRFCASNVGIDGCDSHVANSLSGDMKCAWVRKLSAGQRRPQSLGSQKAWAD